jgi:LPS-assembly protein
MTVSWNKELRIKNLYNIISAFFFLLSAFILLCGHCFAEEKGTVIISDKLEYFSDEKKYVATGSAKVEKEGAVIEADEMTYFEETSDAVASGNVRYNDDKVSIKAGKAELNLDEKTGKLYDAEIYNKRFKFYFSGHEIEKRSEDEYYSPDAAFTSCDAPVPAWCFKAKDVDAITGERIKAGDTTFRIKGLPVFYTPYLWASINTERQTGFLPPVVGYSNAKGAEVNIPFYWFISENSDATFNLDTYSKRGIGIGLEYRFIAPGIKNNWWVYNIRDTEVERDFLAMKGLYEQINPERPGGFLSVNYVNQKDFFQRYSTGHDLRTQRFLDSTGEINAPLNNSRLYLLGQYWVDLQNPTGEVAQRLPEIGYNLNYNRIGDFLVSTSASASNFWQKDGISAGRIDLYPKIAYSLGSDFVLSQVAAFRETGYSFYNAPDSDGIKQRAAFEYAVTAHTRLYKEYSSFTHIIEPSIGYHFIYSSERNLPVFDSSELFAKTSDIELSVLNRIIVKGSELIAFRVTQAIDTYNNSRPSQPLKVEAGIKSLFPLTAEVTYGVDTGKIETVTSDMSFPIFKGTFSFGQRYNRDQNIMVYTFGAQFSPLKSLQTAATLWYDAKSGGLTDLDLKVRYARQCWAVRFEATKQPGNFGVKVMFELAGLNSKSNWAGLPGTHF